MIHNHEKQKLADEWKKFLQEVKNQNIILQIQRKDTDFQMVQAQLLKAQLFTFMKNMYLFINR